MATKDPAAGRKTPVSAQLGSLTERMGVTEARLEQFESLLVELAQQARPEQGAAPQPQERYFASLEQFVELYVLPTWRRRFSSLGMSSWHWCRRWWDHPEARCVFGALWDEWESNRHQALGMIEFTRDVYQLMGELCGGNGPFTRCRIGTGQDRHEQVPAMSSAPAPDWWWVDWWSDDDDQGSDDRMFADLEQFVVGFLLGTFRRDIDAVGMIRWHWCDQWWRHDEVVHATMNLWYLFEARAPQGRLIEVVREVYFLLPHLLGGDGPLRECVPTRRGQPGKHADLTIAPVLARQGAAGQAGEGWLNELLAALARQRRRQAGGPSLALIETRQPAGVG